MLYTDADIASKMVLQRDTEVPITGGAAPGETVTVRVIRNGKTLAEGESKAGEDGRFTVMLPPVSGSREPCEAVVCAGGESLTLTDVLYGDVFHITGQSNMELPIFRVFDPLDPSKPFSGEKRTPDNPYIREFRAPITPCFDPAAEEEYWTSGCWLTSEHPRAAEMSAVGYFFAEELFSRLRVPIGLINTSAGGAPIEGFLPYEELRRLRCCDEFLDFASVPGWMERTAEEDNRRCGEYYAMLDREDRLGERVLAGNYPDGEAVSLPFWINGFSGRIWLWTEFDLPEDFDCGDAMLILGTLTDSDFTYINGEKAGETGYMYPPRYYPAGKTLRPGRNRLAVRLDIFGGQGGFTYGKRWCIKSGDSILDLSENWHYAKAVNAGPLKPATFFQGLPLALYSVTAPVYRRKFKAMVIYQGESNCHNAERYRELFTRFIGYYRERVGREIPVIFTQLPEFGMNDDSWAVLRQAQLDCTLLPQTAMAVTIGTGEVNDLHPINKWDVGRRLALCAGRLVYGGEGYAPVRCTAVKQEGLTVRLIFSEDVTLSRRENSYFEAVRGGVTETLRAEQTAPREITLALTSPQPEQIRYAYMTSPAKPQLFDRDGAPVSPFIVSAD